MFKKIFSYITTLGVLTISAASVKAMDNSVQVLNDLHHANQMEIQMGKLAQKKGNSDGIKKFGDMLVKDHGDADKKVKDTAKSQNIKLEADKMPMGDEQQTMAKLNSLEGEQFDRAFAQAMVEDHRNDISKLQAAQKTVAGTPTGSLVTALLPTLQKHEETASNLVATLK